MTGWTPDEGLIDVVMARPVPIAEMTGEDRAWVVAGLTAEGWTVAAIAERLRCSLRLVQQIKAEETTRVAIYALGLRRSLREHAALARMGSWASLAQIAALEAEVGRLRAQRDILLDRLHPRKTA